MGVMMRPLKLKRKACTHIQTEKRAGLEFQELCWSSRREFPRLKETILKVEREPVEVAGI